MFSWQPGLIDRWLEEEEEVGGHPRDPHKRSKPWLARDTSRSPSTGSCWPTAPLLSSFSKPICRPAITCPREDVQFEALSPSTNRSQCPYKGEADHYWDVAGPVEAKNVAWSYTTPFPAVEKIAGRIAFYNELVDITVDGVIQQRPVSIFSTAANRPGR